MKKIILFSIINLWLFTLNVSADNQKIWEKTLPNKLNITDTNTHIYPVKVDYNSYILNIECDINTNISIENKSAKTGKWKVITKKNTKSVKLTIDNNIRNLKMNANYKVVDLRVYLQNKQEYNCNINKFSPVLTTNIDNINLKNTQIDLPQAGIFRISNNSKNLLWATGNLQEFKHSEDDLILAYSKKIWLLNPLKQNIKLNRIILDTNKKLKLTIPAGKILTLNTKTLVNTAYVAKITAQNGQAGISWYQFPKNKSMQVACNEIKFCSATSFLPINKNENHKLYLWNAGKIKDLPVEISLLAAEKNRPLIKPTFTLNNINLFRNIFTKKGQIVIDVKLTATEKIIGLIPIFHGNNLKITWISEHGRVKYGNKLRLYDSGKLIIQHDKGIFLTWLQGGKYNFWKKLSGFISIKTPQSLLLNDLNDKIVVLRFQQDKATLLNIKIEKPIIVHLDNKNMQKSLIKIADKPKSLLKFKLPQGISYITLTSAKNSDKLSGKIELFTEEIIK
jgi:hypothetical protein